MLLDSIIFELEKTVEETKNKDVFLRLFRNTSFSNKQLKIRLDLIEALNLIKKQYSELVYFCPESLQFDLLKAFENAIEISTKTIQEENGKVDLKDKEGNKLTKDKISGKGKIFVTDQHHKLVEWKELVLSNEIKLTELAVNRINL